MEIFDLDIETSTNTDYINALDKVDDSYIKNEDDITEAVNIDQYESIPNYSSLNQQYDIYRGTVLRDVYAAVRKGDPSDAAFRIPKSAAVGDKKIKYRAPRINADGEIVTIKDTNVYASPDDVEKAINRKEHDEDRADFEKRLELSKHHKHNDKDHTHKHEDVKEGLESNDIKKELLSDLENIKTTTDLSNYLFKVLKFDKNLYADAREIAQNTTIDLKTKVNRIQYLVQKDEIKESTEVSAKTVRESLGRLDVKTDCEYDLRDLFDSLALSAEMIKEIAVAIRDHCEPEEIYVELMNHCRDQHNECDDSANYDLMQRRCVLDFDGEKQDCSWYRNNGNNTFVIIVGDPDIYKPGMCDHEYVTGDYDCAMEKFYELPNYRKDLDDLADEITNAKYLI